MSGWRELFARAVDPASLIVFRVAWGGLMFFHVVSYLSTGRLQRQYIDPPFHFYFPGFSWVRVAPPDVMKWLFVLMALAALGIALGAFYRWAAGFFFVAITYVFLIDPAFYQNHLYLISLISLWVWILPLHRVASVDARRHPGLRRSSLPAWNLWMLQFHVALPYTFGGLAKLNTDWLVRAQPMRLWVSEGMDSKVNLGGFDPNLLGYAISWSGVVFDLAIVPFLLWRRTRLAALVAALSFHVLNHYFFEIGVFPFLMVAASLLFFEPSWPRRWSGVGGVGRAGKAAAKTPPERLRPWSPPSPLVAGLIGAYVVVQLLLPFRHWMIPGNVDWTEEGHRFSWRMKLRDKRGDVRFVAYDRTTGEATQLSGTLAALTRYQLSMMGHDPDLIRQYAAHLARELRAAGSPNLTVRTTTRIAFNGRPPAAQIDPLVDLSEERWRWGAAPWILPEPPVAE